MASYFILIPALVKLTILLVSFGEAMVRNHGTPPVHHHRILAKTQIRKDLRLRRHRALHRHGLRPAAAAAAWARWAPRGGLGALASVRKSLPTKEKHQHEHEHEHRHHHHHHHHHHHDALMFDMGELVG